MQLIYGFKQRTVFNYSCSVGWMRNSIFALFMIITFIAHNVLFSLLHNAFPIRSPNCTLHILINEKASPQLRITRSFIRYQVRRERQEISQGNIKSAIFVASVSHNELTDNRNESKDTISAHVLVVALRYAIGAYYVGWMIEKSVEPRGLLLLWPYVKQTSGMVFCKWFPFLRQSRRKSHGDE